LKCNQQVTGAGKKLFHQTTEIERYLEKYVFKILQTARRTSKEERKEKELYCFVYESQAVYFQMIVTSEPRERMKPKPKKKEPRDMILTANLRSSI
jgi:hypothetical protein